MDIDLTTISEHFNAKNLSPMTEVPDTKQAWIESHGTMFASKFPEQHRDTKMKLRLGDKAESDQSAGKDDDSLEFKFNQLN